MKRDISHCPYCGKQGKVVVDEYKPDPESGPGMGFSTYEVYVRCTKCGACGPVVEYMWSRERVEKTKEAINLWNRRENPSPKPLAQWEDGELEPGEEPATEKQIKFATKIAERFDLELPARKSKKEYWRFISEHRPRWDALFQRKEYDEDIPDDCPFDVGDFC